MGPWLGGLPAPGVMQEGNYHGVFNYWKRSKDGNGSGEIIGVKEETHADRMRKLMRKREKRFEFDPWAAAPPGLNLSETTHLINLLESGAEDKREDVFHDDMKNGINEEHRRKFAGMIETFKEVEEEKKREYIGMLRILVVRMERVRDMERVFTKDCTLFDVLDWRGEVRGEEIVV
jgi:hypothetical protein